VCRYVDLPLQHASAGVLQRMGRPGTRRQYDRLLEDIRRRIPEVTLRTTFIVGFPGETERDVRELEQFVRDTGFDHVGVFTYSHEAGTRAHGLPDDVPAGEKQARRDRVMAVQRELVAERQRRRVGAEVRVLVDGPVPNAPLAWQGRIEGQAPGIDPVTYLSELDPARYPAGSFLTARIVEAHGYDLVAVPLP
jgi:ribosomal protein S12 methylthiotransferase